MEHKFFLCLLLLEYLQLSEGKDEYQKIEENEIECLSLGYKLYEINNQKNHKYLVLIKSNDISEYKLYDKNSENLISPETKLFNDIFFYINGKSSLILYISSDNNKCFSFQFSEYNYLSLKENVDFKHPVIDLKTKISFKILDSYLANIILYINNINASALISFGYKSYSKQKATSIVVEHTELNKENLDVEIIIYGTNLVPSIKYEMIRKYVNNDGDRNLNIGILLVFSLILIPGICVCLIICYKSGRSCWKQNKYENMINTKKRKASEIYYLIKKNYKLIEKTCFICLNNDETETPLFSQENECENKNVDFIKDINDGKFTSLLEYITPKKCPHFFHPNCKRKKCLLCESYITSNNMEHFGCIKENDLLEIVEAYNFDSKYDHIDYKSYNNFRNYRYFDEINRKFYLEIDKSSIIYQNKKEKLKRIQDIKAKYKKNNPYSYRRYDISIYEDLDEVERNLNNEIKKRKNVDETIMREIREEEEREFKHSLFELKACNNCNKKCYYCNCTFKLGEKIKYGIHAHRDCIDCERCCCICKKGSNTWPAKVCESCYKNHKVNSLYCIICDKS